MVAPLTRLTSTLIQFQWFEEVEVAFSRLKALFISAPILSHPDPSHQFIVEVDASDVGVGVALSQQDLLEQKLRTCAFFQLASNYDVGNQELLAVVLALQEWHHWLGGSALTFVVWTNHKNLTYLRSVKWLNSQQARWTLFSVDSVSPLLIVQPPGT